MTRLDFLSQIINGLHVGSIYALVALGYSMVYGIVQLINFAHGDLIMVGGYAAYVVLVMGGMPLVVAVLGSIVACVVIALLMERIAYRRLLNRNVARISLLITAIGVSIFLQNLAQLIFGSSGKAFPAIIDAPPISVGSMQISMVTIVTIIASVVLMIGLQLLVNKTKMGKAMRAVSEDKAAAQLMGINVNRTISMTFAIGSALAAIAGVLLCSYSPVLQPTTGAMPGIKAFDAAVFGGIGSIPGAFVGGILIGIIEAMAQAYISTSLANSIVFGVLIIVLLVKPAGLLGKYVPEKV